MLGSNKFLLFGNEMNKALAISLCDSDSTKYHPFEHRSQFGLFNVHLFHFGYLEYLNQRVGVYLILLEQMIGTTYKKLLIGQVGCLKLKIEESTLFDCSVSLNNMIIDNVCDYDKSLNYATLS